jgi:hypothetical protein
VHNRDHIAWIHATFLDKATGIRPALLEDLQNNTNHCPAQGHLDMHLEQIIIELWGHFGRQSPHSQPIKDVFGPPLKVPAGMFPGGTSRKGSLIDGPLANIRGEGYQSKDFSQEGSAVWALMK